MVSEEVKQITSVSSGVLYPLCNNILSVYIPRGLQVMYRFFFFFKVLGFLELIFLLVSLVVPFG